MLFSGRKREEDNLRREASGESLWSPTFTQSSRVKIVYALYDAVRVENYRRFTLETAHARLGRLYGLLTLTGSRDMAEDLTAYFYACSDENVPDVIEALCLGLMEARNSDSGFHFVEPQQFHNEVNDILRLERISFDLVTGKMVDFESREMHESIIAPTITLLAGKAGWDSVETAYRDALNELGRNPGNAITDATTALQQALELRHCDGNSLGDLAKSAVARNVLTPYDIKLIDWANADRGLKGDAHNSPDAATSDAWLVVHIVGALILRLASGEAR
jgi:hypothetical protein